MSSPLCHALLRNLDLFKPLSDAQLESALRGAQPCRLEAGAVVYHYRGAYLNAVSNILEWDMPKHPVYLWTLPLFHCNGWCFAWTVAARAGVNVCLRKFDPKTVFLSLIHI